MIIMVTLIVEGFKVWYDFGIMDDQWWSRDYIQQKNLIASQAAAIK